MRRATPVVLVLTLADCAAGPDYKRLRRAVESSEAGAQASAAEIAADNR